MYYLRYVCLFFGFFSYFFSEAYAEINTIKKILPGLLVTLPKKHQKISSEISYEQLERMVMEYSVGARKELLQQNWLKNNNPFSESFFKVKQQNSFKPFAQKVVVPVGSEIAFFGDLHGNMTSLMDIVAFLKQQNYLDANLKIIKNNFFMIFLGDYVDRGKSGVEVIYTLLLLKVANPDNVFLVRGNHEDKTLNTVYGFKDELQQKFPQKKQEELDFIFRIYDFMPTVLFLGSGSDFIQCCHGGMEIGYDAKELLAMKQDTAYQVLNTVSRVESVRQLPSLIKQDVIKYVPAQEIINFVPKQPTHPVTLGFMWNDFIENAQHYRSEIVDHCPGRGWIFGEKLTSLLLAKNSTPTIKVRAVFRAHQHHGGMLKLLQQQKGIVKLWEGMVHTFLTASIPHVDFPYTSLGILTTAAVYQDWSLEHHVI